MGGFVLAARQTGGIIMSASDIGENFIFHLTIYNSGKGGSAFEFKFDIVN